MNRSICLLRVVAPGLVLALSTSNCLGAFFTNFGRLPTPDVPYQLINAPVRSAPPTSSLDSIWAIYSLEFQAADPAHVEYPTIDHENDLWLLDSMFDIDYTMQMSIGLGPVFPVAGQGQMHVVGSPPAGLDSFTREFQLELVQMELFPSQLDPVMPIFLRESPLYESIGVTTVVDLCPFCGAFHWQIDSFFDVFAEISLDGGQTWTPGAGPLRIVQTPEPNSLVLLLGGLGFVCRRR